MGLINLDNFSEQTPEGMKTRLMDGPFDGAEVPRPAAKYRKIQHCISMQLGPEQQPELMYNRLRFAIYMWMVKDMRYGFVDCITVGSEQELQMAMKIAAGSDDAVR